MPFQLDPAIAQLIARGAGPASRPTFTKATPHACAASSTTD